MKGFNLNKGVFAAAVAIVALSSTVATAASKDAAVGSAIYVGVGVGESKYDYNLSGVAPSITITSQDKKDTAAKFFLGGAITPYVGWETGYVNFGKGSVDAIDTSANTYKAKIHVKSLYGAVTASAPINDSFKVFGKAGIALHDTSISNNDSSFLASSEKSSPLFGLGAQFAITPKWSATVEYEDFGKVDKGGDKVKLTSVSARYSF